MLVINQLIPGTFEVVTDRGVSESIDEDRVNQNP
jgi:hypothetical protein